MLFNSISFAIFLPVVFLLYWFVFSRKLKLQNSFILVSSYVFYGWWDWRFLSLIFISSISDFVLGRYIFRTSQTQKRRIFLVLSLAINLGMLGFFKYYNFFVGSFAHLAGTLGLNPHLSTLQIILPVGISFYTFQTLSYTIDIYRRKIEPTNDIIAFFAFVSFFPQLVAGPIERASRLLPQFAAKRQFKNEDAEDGLRQILWGLIKKVVVADTLAIQADQIFNTLDYSSTPGITLIFGSVLFTFQLYCDFSGYSDIAIGTAKLFGFRLMRNFALPFFSRNIAEFWQRWHISLSTWFRDYVFIPLGGSRVSKLQQIRNISVTFVVSGLWHGANWTFIIWGALHALYYLPLLLFKNRTKYTEIVAYKKLLPSFKEFVQMILTFGLVAFSMIFFRATSLSRSVSFIKNMLLNLHKDAESIWVLLTSVNFFIIVLLILVEWIQRHQEHALKLNHVPAFPRRVIYAVSIAIFIYFGQFGDQQQFIYFQF